MTASRLAAAGSLVLATLSCAHARAPREIPAALVDCPEKVSSRPILDAQGQVERREDDTNGDGRVDQILHFRGSRVESSDLDLDYDGIFDFAVSYDELGHVVSTRRLPRPSDADAVPEASKAAAVEGDPFSQLARRTSVSAECLRRPDVSLYLERIQGRMYAHWAGWPSLNARAILSFTLAANGELLGACLRSATSPDIGAEAVRALLLSVPFPPLETADCLAGHRLVGTFAVR